MLKIYNIQSRRYIGSKTKLIDDILKSLPQRPTTIIDPFSGTGIVASELLKQGHHVIVNDLLYSNYVVYKAFFGSGSIDEKKLISIIEDLNIANPGRQNYMSKNFGGKYFSTEVAKKIGFIREAIERKSKSGDVNDSEKEILIASLMYSMDRYANTVGHYEMFLKNVDPKKQLFVMGIINLEQRNSSIDIYNIDANELVKAVNAPVVYLDPPYNARQYINFYHMWENVAKWEKPELSWESLKFDRRGMKSDYSKSKAPEAMKELVSNLLDSNLIVASYNNTYDAKSGASNNKIKPDEMKQILSMNHRKFSYIELDHKFFNSGKTSFKNHKELLYISKK